MEAGFWQAYQHFLKEPLATEMPHPQTAQLSQLASTQLLQAYTLLASLDEAALDCVDQQTESILTLQKACSRTLSQGGRILLIGCGASGRIAAQIEHDWRLIHQDKADRDALISVLAGGDVTLIEAVEACEDRPEYAISQLDALGLLAEDLVIALSAGGESPFILGALDYAQSKTSEAPWFLYCNSDLALLKRNPAHPVGRPGFCLFPLEVGPMALTGSTRMQATTAMTFALMQALFPDDFNAARWRGFCRKLEWAAILPLTLWEEGCYQRSEPVIYKASASLAMPVLADMTERSPTFNLPRFPNQQDFSPVLLNYVILSDVIKGQESAWQALLLRQPRSFSDRLKGFDLSHDVLNFLQKITQDVQFLTVLQKQNNLVLCFGAHQIAIECVDLTLIEMCFLLRLILVNHSTLMMGRQGYYQGNLMTNLKPSNFKLIDRTIRYVLFLYEEDSGKKLDYDAVAKKLFELLPNLKPQESIVFKLLATFKS